MIKHTQHYLDKEYFHPLFRIESYSIDSIKAGLLKGSFWVFLISLQIFEMVRIPWLNDKNIICRFQGDLLKRSLSFCCISPNLRGKKELILEIDIEFRSLISVLRFFFSRKRTDVMYKEMLEICFVNTLEKKMIIIKKKKNLLPFKEY